MSSPSTDISNRLSHGLFLLGAILFIGFKWQDLMLPLYWDEIGVYGPGILYMVDHGISLFPAGLDPELSRGHPLFFYFLFAVWVKMLGYSLLKLHVFALLISLGLFGTVYHISRQYTSKLLALIATFWLMVQGAVFAQASLALPEILLSLEILWALYFFVRKNPSLYFICAACALLTKESALVLPLACVGLAVLEGRKEGIQYMLKTSLVALAPVSIYLAFLMIQKQTHGWYFFPYHVELVSFQGAEILKKLGDYLTWLLWDQGRWGATLLSVICGIFLLYKKQSLANPFLLIILIFSFGFLAFGSLNVYMDRYLIALFPLFALGMALLMDKWNLKGIMKGSLGMLTILLAMLSMSQETFRFDVDINYRDFLEVQEEATTYLEQHVPPQQIFLANFPLFNGFQDPRFGLAKDTLHHSVTVIPHDSLHFRALMVPPSFANALPKEGELIQVFEKGYTKVEIYVKR